MYYCIFQDVVGSDKALSTSSVKKHPDKPQSAPHTERSAAHTERLRAEKARSLQRKLLGNPKTKPMPINSKVRPK